MILGQLIQTGRRFCECRSNDFIPKSEDRLVVMSYSIHDHFQAHSFDADDAGLVEEIRRKLIEHESIAYILIQRVNHRRQSELPFPIGRKPMHRITLTAATQHDFLSESYYLEKVWNIDAFRLIPTSLTDRNSEVHHANLFQFPREKGTDSSNYLLPQFEEIAG